jgi:protein-L-isoaspartate(D-aspartate) O-methyltransferase
MISDADAKDHINRLANEIEKNVDNPAVTAAFRAVPRHRFVMQGFHAWDNESRQMKPHKLESTAQEDWLKAVYTNQVLMVELGNNPSSSSEPILMAQMLKALDVKTGMRVLEIGTGTGYNAALLAELVGESGEVVSVDNQTHLIERARPILNESYGGRVKLFTGDGYLGFPDLAPYDRIIATANPPRVPPAWIKQLRMGGKILGNVGNGGALLLLERNESKVEGHFLDHFGYFMPLLNTQDQTERWLEPVDFDSLDSPDFGFYWGGVAAGNFYNFYKRENADGAEERVMEFRSSNGKSLVNLQNIGEKGRFVKSKGEDAFLDMIVALVERWHDLGKPKRSDYRVTVEEDGRQVVSLHSIPLTEL